MVTRNQRPVHSRNWKRASKVIKDMLTSLPRIRIALAVTAAAATLQAVYHPSKSVLYGPLNGELMTFLMFGLIKVLGFGALSLLCARELCHQLSQDRTLRKADTFLFAMLTATLLLALYLFVGVRTIRSEVFIAQFGAGTPQAIAVAILAVLMIAIITPYYRRQYYDQAIIINVGADDLQRIQGDRNANSLFVKTFTKKLAFAYLPLLAVHVYIVKNLLNDRMFIAPPIADGFVTCALALILGYAIAATHREMASGLKRATS